MDWSKYPNFTKKEFDCQHTGRNEMRPEFLDLLQAIRTDYNKPMVITSGYRDPSHPVEAEKVMPGSHTYGVACDIAVKGVDAIELIMIAAEYGIRRIGVNQKDNGRFIHLDIADKIGAFGSSIWSY